MSIYDLYNDEIRSKSDVIAKLETISIENYEGIIPEDMDAEFLDNVNYKVFGVETMDIYLCRNIFNAKSIMITEFLSNGFFWAQMEHEALSQEFRDLFAILNNSEETINRKVADLNKKWCVAEFMGEWFRAYIQNVTEEKKLKLFFVDYGTTAYIDHSNTWDLDDDKVWEVPPLAIPFVVKDLPVSKLAKFKKLQYEVLNIKSLKLIEKTFVFEVELTDKNDSCLLEILK